MQTLIFSELCLLAAGSFVLTGVSSSRSPPVCSHVTIGVLWRGGGGEGRLLLGCGSSGELWIRVLSTEGERTHLSI